MLAYDGDVVVRHVWCVWIRTRAVRRVVLARLRNGTMVTPQGARLTFPVLRGGFPILQNGMNSALRGPRVVLYAFRTRSVQRKNPDCATLKLSQRWRIATYVT